MLVVKSVHKLEEMENVLRRVLQRHGIVLHAVAHLGHVFQDQGRDIARDAYSYTLCHPDFYTALMAADGRFAAFLPCRIAAWTEGGAVTLGAVSPREYSRILNRPDLDRLVAPMETLLREIIEEAARPLASQPHAPRAVAGSGLGAVEGQVSIRGAIPQRIDCHGTKIEELAGTGQHDAAGG